MKVNFRAGMVVKIDTWKEYQASTLVAPDVFDKEYFGDRIHFRLPSPTFTNIEPAIRIEQTGRTVQWKFFGQSVVRVKVTWITDNGENEQSAHGWVYVNYDDYE